MLTTPPPGEIGHAGYLKTGPREFGLEDSLNDFLRRFNENNEQAFTLCYRRLYSHVYYFALRFGDHALAADLTADAFYKLWKADKRFQGIPAIKIFLQVTVKNHALNQLKRDKMVNQKHRFLASQTEHDQSAFVEGPDDFQKHLLEKMYMQIEQLPDRSGRIFRMSFLQGLKNKQIAKKLGLSENTVRNQKARAVKLLRLQLL